jgi:hypothetical protein
MGLKISFPSISSKLPPDVQQFLQRVREEFHKGGVVTEDDLVSAGIASRTPSGGLASGVVDYSIPPAPTGVTASGTITAIFLQWDNPDDIGWTNFSYAEIWRSEENNLGTAALLGTSGFFTYVDSVDPASIFYYWVRFVSRADISGPFHGTVGVMGTTNDSPERILGILDGSITATELHQTLGQRIELIDGTGTGSVNTRIASEANIRAQAILDEASARTGGDSALQQQINVLSAASSGDLSDLIAAVETEATARAAADSAEATARETLATQLRGSYAGTDVSQVTTGLVYSERNARVDADGALSNSISALSSTVTNNYGTLSAAIQNEATARVSQDGTLASSISTVSATVATKNRTYKQSSAPDRNSGRMSGDLWIDSDDKNKLYRWDGDDWVGVSDTRIATTQANLSTEVTARATADSALAARATTLESAVNNPTTGLATKASLSYVDTAKADAISSSAASIATVQAQLDTGGATALEILDAQTAANTAIAGVAALDTTVGQLSLDIAATDSAISAEESARINAINAEQVARAAAIQSRITEEARLDGLITGEETARIALGEQLVIDYQAYADTVRAALIDNEITDAEQSAIAEAQLRINLAKQSLIDNEILDAQTAANTAIANAETANAALADMSSDSVLSPSEKHDVVLAYNSLIAEQSGIDAQATAYSITTQKTAYDTAVLALTTYLNGLVGWNVIPGDSVAIVGVTFRANFQSVYTSRQALLNSIYAKAKTLADTAIANANTATTNAATAQTTANAAVTSSSANATSISNVQARLDTGDYAAVKVQSSASASAVEGLQAEHTVKLDVDGKVIGFGLMSDGPSGEADPFEIRADRFIVAAPSGYEGDAAVPFVVDTVSGKTVIDGAVIKTASIQTAAIEDAAITNAKIVDLSASKITSGEIVGKDIELNTGGVIRCGQTAFNTGYGFWLGMGIDGYARLSVGSPEGPGLDYDESTGVLNFRGLMELQSGSTIGGISADTLSGWASDQDPTKIDGVNIHADSSIVTGSTTPEAGSKYSVLSGGEIEFYDYYNGGFNLFRSLKKITTGTCVDGQTVNLGYFRNAPQVIITPKSLESYNATYAAQSQKFVLEANNVRQYGTDWYFDAKCQLQLASGAGSGWSTGQYQAYFPSSAWENSTLYSIEIYTGYTSLPANTKSVSMTVEVGESCFVKISNYVVPGGDYGDTMVYVYYTARIVAYVFMQYYISGTTWVDSAPQVVDLTPSTLTYRTLFFSVSTSPDIQAIRARAVYYTSGDWINWGSQTAYYEGSQPLDLTTQTLQITASSYAISASVVSLAGQANYMAIG